MVSFGTLFFVIIIFLLIIFLILVLNSKKKESAEKGEIEEIGWEIVKEIKTVTDGYFERLEKEKAEIELKINELKAEKERSAAMEQNKAVGENGGGQGEYKKKEVKSKRIAEISLLYSQGKNVDEIANELNLYKGFVQVVVNMQTMKKHG